MDFGLAKVILGYLGASAAALVASVKLACILGGPMMFTFGGSFFR